MMAVLSRRSSARLRPSSTAFASVTCAEGERRALQGAAPARQTSRCCRRQTHWHCCCCMQALFWVDIQ